MTILAMLSPPDIGGVIAQAMAIQAHRPSTVILIRVSLGSTVAEYDGIGLLNAWVQGSKKLEEMFPDLDKPYPFPMTPPKGYISPDGTIPEINIIDVEKDMVVEKLASLADTYMHDEMRFDYLPGGKFLKLPLLVDNRFKEWEISYTLQTGNYILFEEKGHSIQTGLPLSIVDRCWIAGFPVHVDQTWPVTQEMNDFYSGIIKCLRIEPYTDEQKQIDIGKKSIKSSMIKKRTHNRPMGFNSSETLEQLIMSGYEVIDDKPGQITISKSGLKWPVVLIKDGVIAGNSLETLMSNILSLHWNPADLIQGVSIIEPTAERRLDKYRNLLLHLQKRYDEHPNSLAAIKYQEKCAQFGFEYSVPIEDLLNAEIKKMRDDYNNGTVEEPLIRIRICEIDALLLDEHEIISFDAKAVMGDGYKPLDRQKTAMQRPDFLRPTHYYVIACTKPGKNGEGEDIIHFSRLNRGRKILMKENKYKWWGKDPALKEYYANKKAEKEEKKRRRENERLERQEKEKRIADSKEIEENQRRRKPRRRGGSKTQPKRGNRGGKPKEE